MNHPEPAPRRTPARDAAPDPGTFPLEGSLPAAVGAGMERLLGADLSRTFRDLPPRHRERLSGIVSAGPSDGSLAAVRAVTSPALQNAHPALQKHVLRLISAYVERPAVAAAVSEILGHSSFPAIRDPKTQADCLDVYVALPARARPLLSRAISALSSGGGSALLDRDCLGATLVGNLRSLAANRLAPAFRDSGLSRGALVAQILHEALWPTHAVNQGIHKGTCAAVCLHYMICRENPAEYARLMLGLLTRGRVELASGDALDLSPGSLRRDETYPDRSDSERIFHAALMEYANGGSYRYDNGSDRHYPADERLPVLDPGLRSSMIRRALSGLFAEEFDLWESRSRRELEDRRPWWKRVLDVGSADIARSLADAKTAEVAEWLRTHEGEHLLIGLSWSGADRMHGRHAVVYEGFRDGRYHFRNPWGALGIPDGTDMRDPRRRVEHGATGRESMAAKDFEERLCILLAPVSAGFSGWLAGKR